MDGDYYEAMIDKGQWWQFGQDKGDTPLLFTRYAKKEACITYPKIQGSKYLVFLH